LEVDFRAFPHLLSYSHIYTPVSPEKTPQLRKPSLVAQNLQTDKDTEESKLEFLEILGYQGGFSKLGSLFWGNWHIYTPVSPEKTPQLRKPSLVAQNLQKLQFTLLRILIGIGHRILIYRPRLAHEHPTIGVSGDSGLPRRVFEAGESFLGKLGYIYDCN
jgi:hypothetical protein